MTAARLLAGVRLGRLAAATALGTLASLAGAAMVGLAGYLVCRAAEQPPILSLTTVAVGVRATALLRPLARYGERLWSHDVALRHLGEVRSAVYRRLVPLAPAEAEPFRDGDLLARAVADVDATQNLVLRVLLPAGVALGAGSTVVAVLATAVSGAAAAVVAAGLLAGAVLPGACALAAAARTARRQAALRGTLTAELVEAADAAEELWLAGADEQTAAGIAATDRALGAVARRDGWAAGVANAADVVVCGCTTAVLLVVTTSAAGRGELDPLLVAPLVLVGVAVFEVVRPLAVAARTLPALLASCRRVLALLEAEPTVTEPTAVTEPTTADAVEIGVLDGEALDGEALDVELGGVTVRRGAPRRVAVRDAELRCAAGERVLLAGPSGSGKTTVAYLLVRFLDRDAGTARFGGHDLRAWPGDTVRSRILLSEQEPHVFDTTIRENVALARPAASDAEISEALRRARLDSFVASLPAGADTAVGERGRRLSAGQRQRLSLARAFLLDPDVLILDEPTAHLDAVTAAGLLGDLWHEAGDRSVVLVTHADPGPFAGCRRYQLPATR